MKRDPDEEVMDRIIEEIPSVNPVRPEASPAMVEFFESLSNEEQDQILKMIIANGGFNRITEMVQSPDTPGAMDIFLDRIRYFHFFPIVKE